MQSITNSCSFFSLPWAEDKPFLSGNLYLAKKRFTNVTQKLLVNKIYEKYKEVFISQLDDKILEKVAEFEISFYGYYLHHRPVAKIIAPLQFVHCVTHQ